MSTFRPAHALILVGQWWGRNSARLANGCLTCAATVVDMGDRQFQGVLKQFAADQGWNWATLAERTGYDRSHIWAVANGRKRPSKLLVADLDTALDAGGRLLEAWENEDVEVNRRELLWDVAPLALVPALAGVELLRHSLHEALGGSPVELWQQAVDEYARGFYEAPPAVLLRNLLADLEVLQRQLGSAREADQLELRRCAAYLAAVAALTWTTLGEPQQAGRWWASARMAADGSGNIAARVWVRAWEVCNGPYTGTPAAETFAIAAEAAELAENRADVGAASLYAGLAQAQAAAGHPSTLVSLQRVADVTEQLPSAVLADRTSLLAWPEVRLRFTQSYVHTLLGSATEAYAAQDIALSQYGDTMPSDRIKVELHRARCMVVSGDVSGGLTYAHDALDRYPLQTRGSVWGIARDLLGILSVKEGSMPRAAALRERLAITQ